MVALARRLALQCTSTTRAAWLLLALCAFGSHSQTLPQSPLQATVQRAVTAHNAPASSITATTLTPERTLADIDAQEQEMRTRLAAAQADLGKVQNSLRELSTLDVAAHASATERQEDLQVRVDTYLQIIDNIKNLRRLVNKLTNERQDRQAWRPPAGAPPWPLAVGDALYFEIMRVQGKVQHLVQRSMIIDEQIAALRKTRAAVESELRQAPQKAEPSAQPASSPVAQSITASEHHLSRMNLALINLSIDKDSIEVEQATAAILLASLRQTWDSYHYRFVFSTEDYNKIRFDIDKNIEQLRHQEQQASIRINRTLDQAAAAKTRLDGLENTAATPAEALLNARRAWRTADMQAEAARIEREKQRAQIDLNLISLQVWDIRHQLYSNDNSGAQISTLVSRERALSKRLEQGLGYLTQVIAEKSQTAFDLSNQLQKTTDAAEKVFLNGLLTPLSQQIDTTRDLYALIGRTNQYLSIVQAELEHADTNKTLWQKLNGYKTLAISLIKDLWHYEILAIDDTIVVDGREIKTKRGITIGKSVGAFAILIFGFMLISGLIRRTLALAVNKANLGASKSVVLGRWLTLFAGFTLILTAFNLVDIPLSAFAFLGGALAIGVGFGTQNILKNLISGVMLLIEKPIRIGDLVEIDGILGTVTSIGIRFSTVHGPQGNDTLIPNSVLVEQKLVNWTYSTPNGRKDVKVTVGYGSNVGVVKEILTSVGTSHPHVMGTPAPLITLDSFAENGLVFNLQFWIKLQSDINTNAVLSELREQILERFASAGIELPFPQRTVLFDTNTPLSVKVQQHR